MVQEQTLTSRSVPALLDGHLWQPVIVYSLVQSTGSLSAHQGGWEPGSQGARDLGNLRGWEPGSLGARDLGSLGA